jgi:hypothetical protein
MESTALADAKAAANEAAKAVEALEAEEQGTTTGTGTGTVTQYSSSVTSCTVDPETGNISLSVELYPGDNPIVPVPVPGAGPATTVEAPEVAEEAPEGGGVPAA